MNPHQLAELLLQALEHEKGGIKVYTTALSCVVNPELKKEWTKYLDETSRHVEVLTQTCRDLGLDPEKETAGRAVIRHTGAALVNAMNLAREHGEPEAAQLVACECVVLAETKDHLNWSLLGSCAERVSGKQAQVLRGAYGAVEDEEDEHLYHSKGWCRELWLESLGLDAVLPPPEERRHVKTAIGAARAEAAADRARG